jgi:multimeric flavodoxin WrbA
MTRLAIIYFSATGTTEKLAHAVERGAATNTSVTLCRITGDDIISGRFLSERTMQAIDASDGVAFGSPTYMGGPSAQFKAFADATSERWSKQVWAGKVAAGFTTGAFAGGDQLNTLTYFSILAAQHGMLWCGIDIAGEGDPNGLNRLGSQLGLATHLVGGELIPGDVRTAEYLGTRLARIARRKNSEGPSL